MIPVDKRRVARMVASLYDELTVSDGLTRAEMLEVLAELRRRVDAIPVRRVDK